MGSVQRKISFGKKDRTIAFTLVEIALAVGIFAFAIVAIFSLFPVGLRSANESRVQSTAMQIARTIFSDLRTPPLYEIVTHSAPPGPDTKEPLLNASNQQMGTFKAALVAIKDPQSNSPKNAFVTVDLSATTTTTYLLYTANGKVAKVLSNAAAYDAGDSSGDYVVKIESKIEILTDPKLSQVTVTIEAPAAALKDNRSKYPVVTLMGDTR